MICKYFFKLKTFATEEITNWNFSTFINLQLKVKVGNGVLKEMFFQQDMQPSVQFLGYDYITSP